jgi:hypothetical protein
MTKEEKPQQEPDAVGSELSGSVRAKKGGT